MSKLDDIIHSNNREVIVIGGDVSNGLADSDYAASKVLLVGSKTMGEIKNLMLEIIGEDEDMYATDDEADSQVAFVQNKLREHLRQKVNEL